MAERRKINKMEKKIKKASIFGILTVVLLISVAVGLFMQSGGLTQMSKLIVHAQSNPDIYDNRIWSVEIWQDKTGSFEKITEVLAPDYTEGQTIEIDANYPTKLRTMVVINATLIGLEFDLADDYTQVFWTISDVCTDKLGTYDSTESGMGEYDVLYWSDTWTPSSDTIYTVSLKYEAFY